VSKVKQARKVPQDPPEQRATKELSAQPAPQGGRVRKGKRERKVRKAHRAHRVQPDRPAHKGQQDLSRGSSTLAASSTT
jgi:hypothetical protein